MVLPLSSRTRHRPMTQSLLDGSCSCSWRCPCLCTPESCPLAVGLCTWTRPSIFLSACLGPTSRHAPNHWTGILLVTNRYEWRMRCRALPIAAWSTNGNALSVCDTLVPYFCHPPSLIPSHIYPLRSNDFPLVVSLFADACDS